MTAAEMPTASRRPPAVPVVSGLVFAVLVAMSSRYGYHRDELYFVEAGKHLAWAYPDQGPIAPLIARAMTALSAHSLTVLRLPSALAAAGIVYLTGLIARELRASQRAQLIAAGCVAVAVIILFAGHTLSTTTFDLLAWAAVSLFVLRAQRDGRWWVAAGAVIGVACLNKPLPGFLAVALIAALAIVGPRRHFRTRWLWLGAIVAVVLALPFVIWQARHGWPQIKVSSSISNGGSTSSAPWWEVVPFQALLAGPLLTPVWVAGLVRLFRDVTLRFLAVTWLLLALVFMATGGKPYYLAGLLPLLIAAGAGPFDEWLAARQARRVTSRVVFWASAVVAAFIALPLLPASSAGIVVAMNPDVGETIGWPDFAATIAGVYRSHPGSTILTQNYGEAGAVDRFGPSLGLPIAYSGHNGFGYWGPPPTLADDRPVIVVGYSLSHAAKYLTGCAVAAHVHDAAGIDNDENGGPVLVCAHIRDSWATQWPHIKHLS